MSIDESNPINPLPEMFRLRQHFATSPTLTVSETVQQEIRGMTDAVRPGMNIAIGVGSRGITNLQIIVAEAIKALTAAGASPFIIPAMGSHGGATAEAQTSLLAEYGISKASMGVPIRADMATGTIGHTEENGEIVWAKAALEADGIMVINRIKPHTDFAGKMGSGLIKMAVVGLGKRVGASNFHRAASRTGYEVSLRKRFRVIAQKTKFLGGLGLIEDQSHQTAHIEWVPSDSLEEREEVLFKKASDLMPKIPFDQVDLLIVDRIGKNISGAGMDPNVIGRSVHGYLTSLQKNPDGLTARRIFVRDLTPETHGNAIGIGLADMTTRRLVEAMNHSVTFINALTALSTNGAKIPIYFDTDKEAIFRVLDTLALDKLQDARILRIQDTLNLTQFQASEAYLAETESRTDLSVESAPKPMTFTKEQQLTPMV
jgi:hypothetical protein